MNVLLIMEVVNKTALIQKGVLYVLAQKDIILQMTHFVMVFESNDKFNLVYFKLLDFDECSQDGIKICDQFCFNTPGSYKCMCQEGYELNSTLNTCNG